MGYTTPPNFSGSTTSRKFGQEMGLELDDSDISIAHPLPTFSDVKDDKVIVKFTRRETRNEFYSK